MTTMDIRRRHEGAAAVEFGLLVMVLVVLTFGMTEIGRAFSCYNALVTSTRMAARYLSTQAPHEKEGAARCLAVYGDVVCQGNDPLVPRLTSAMVQFTYEADVATGAGENTIDLVKVTVVGYPFVSFVPTIVSDMIFGDIACTMRQVDS